MKDYEHGCMFSEKKHINNTNRNHNYSNEVFCPSSDVRDVSLNDCYKSPEMKNIDVKIISLKPSLYVLLNNWCLKKKLNYTK